MFRRTFYPLSKNLSDPLIVGNHVDQLENHVTVAPVQFHAVGVLRGYNTLLIALHGKGNGHTHGNFIQAVLVAHGMCYQDHFRIGVADPRAETLDRRIFNRLRPLTGKFSFLDNVLVPGAHGTASAGA